MYGRTKRNAVVSLKQQSSEPLDVLSPGQESTTIQEQIEDANRERRRTEVLSAIENFEQQASVTEKLAQSYTDIIYQCDYRVLEIKRATDTIVDLCTERDDVDKRIKKLVERQALIDRELMEQQSLQRALGNGLREYQQQKNDIRCSLNMQLALMRNDVNLVKDMSVSGNK